MINTTGIQSTGPQGLPGSPSLAAVVDEQAVAQFDAMMAQPKTSSSVEDAKAKIDELKSKLKTAEENLNAASQTGDPNQIIPASIEYIEIRRTLETFSSLL